MKLGISKGTRNHYHFHVCLKSKQTACMFEAVWREVKSIK